MTYEQKKFIDEVGRCELCGSKRNLQLHHVIPRVCENDFLDLDVEDNWLCVCGSCHAKLTPKNLLTKYGISKVKVNNAIIKLKYTLKGESLNKKLDFADWISAEVDDGVTLRATEILREFIKTFELEDYYEIIEKK